MWLSSMKKLVIILSLFLIGCTSNNGKSLGISESTISCINPTVGQYTYGKDFDSSNCESVIAFLTKVTNTEVENRVKMVWFYNEEVILTKEEVVMGSGYANSSLIEPENGYLKGSYRIKVYLNDNYVESFDFSFK